MILETITKRASLNNPQYSLAEGADALFDMLAGGTSLTGVNVNTNTILGYPAVWRGINLLSGDIAKLPLVVYRRLREGGKEKDRTHPAHRLVARNPNVEMTAFNFWRTIVGHALSTGGGYAVIFRGDNAEPQEMVLLDPKVTRLQRGPDRQLAYVTKLPGSHIDIPIAPMNILHIKGLGWNGITGYSITEKLQESLSLGMAAQKYGAVYFGNNTTPKMVIEMKGSAGKTKEERLEWRRRWDDMHKGVENQHRVAILENEAKLQTIAINNEEAQFLQTREFEIRQVANILGVPPHKLGDTTRTSFASLEQENQSYLDESLDPWLRNIEQEASDKLLTEKQKEEDTHFIEFLRQALVRANLKDRYAAYNTALNGGWMNKDEIRDRENMNPIPDGAGKIFLAPMNMQPAGGGDDEEKEQPDKEQDGNRREVIDAHQQLLEHELDVAVRRLKKSALAAAKRPDQFLEWLDRDLDHHRDVLLRTLEPAVLACETVTGSTLNESIMIVDQLIDHMRSDLLSVSGRVTPDGLYEAVAEAMRRIAGTVPVDTAASVMQVA